jgi:hypothetical protein
MTVGVAHQYLLGLADWADPLEMRLALGRASCQVDAGVAAFLHCLVPVRWHYMLLVADQLGSANCKQS